jgi:glycine/serine hydroxymethyltransferase
MSLFGAEHANVQPYSGSPANLAVYLAFLQPGETVMGMGLPAGGHLTHGWNVSITGKYFRAVHYGVRKDTGRIDYDEVRDLARKERPKLIWAGGTAVPRIIDFAAFVDIAREVGAIFAADIAHISGLVAAGVHPSPVPVADVISTTTHKTLRGPRGGMLLCKDQLCDLTSKGVPGKVAAQVLDRAGIVLNYNSVPFDTRKPFDPSGIRLGTAAITSRGMAEPEMARIAAWIEQVVARPADAELLASIATQVTELCDAHPAPGIVVS